MKTSTMILSILLGISVIGNVLLFVSLGVNQIEWENDYNNLGTEWCEINNEYVDLSNSLLIELQTLNPVYNDIEFLEEVDCWVEE